MAEEDNQQTNMPQPDDELKTIPTLMDSGCHTVSKTTWPEVVGLTADEAEMKIKKEKPRIQIQVVPPDHFVTMDFRTNRVRLYVDSSGKVVQPPRIG
ncbi:subtilisin inhibitor CLSI-I-like isoform X1 [Cornus florida]|uniref:subtilisin inhibitor CLSI-I-like isoform X1 n=1 Tax=Cornus florida TaxID=4283 RepID=UPI002897BE1D|nr:subtilisin inhibitor CLSI-I-like isoform X1 [Cornus florida]